MGVGPSTAYAPNLWTGQGIKMNLDDTDGIDHQLPPREKCVQGDHPTQIEPESQLRRPSSSLAWRTLTWPKPVSDSTGIRGPDVTCPGDAVDSDRRDEVAHHEEIPSRPRRRPRPIRNLFHHPGQNCTGHPRDSGWEHWACERTMAGINLQGDWELSAQHGNHLAQRPREWQVYGMDEAHRSNYPQSHTVAWRATLPSENTSAYFRQDLLTPESSGKKDWHSFLFSRNYACGTPLPCNRLGLGPPARKRKNKKNVCFGLPPKMAEKTGKWAPKLMLVRLPHGLFDGPLNLCWSGLPQGLFGEQFIST